VIVLVIGGTRSGKSEIGERRIAELAGDVRVTVVVPAVPTDPEFSARIEQHRARRPSTWSTIECGAELVAAVARTDGPLLVDSLGSWVAVAGDEVKADELVAALVAREAPVVVVTEEVGLAVHAPTDAGRRFTDVLGDVNAAVSAVADEAILVVAGRTVPLDP
jgi:adenosyl cobinamide kinase/adenosyl cobinamide phosphate guanylyltransferase